MRQLRGRTLRIVKFSGVLLTALIAIYYLLAALKTKVTPLYANGVIETHVGDIHYDFSTGMFTLSDKSGVYLQGIISETLRSTSALPCKPEMNNGQHLCLHWLRYAKLQVIKSTGDYDCHEILWVPTSRDFNPHDCISMRSAEWYGGGQLYNQKWPLQKNSVPLQPYLANDVFYKEKHNKQYTNTFGNVVERFWINSKGVGVIVDSAVPLLVSINDTGSNLLCFSADINHPRYSGVDVGTPVLQYSICKQPDVKKIHQLLNSKHFEIPAEKPDPQVIKYPTFTSEPRFRNNFTEVQLNKYTKKFKLMFDKAVKFDKLFYELDGNYSSAVGNFDMDSKLFPHSAQMISIMKEDGYLVTASLTPMINKDSRNFDAKSKLWIQDREHQSLGLSWWYYGLGSVLDVTNNDAVTWYKSQLTEMMKNLGLYAFKFYACESNFIPKVQVSVEQSLNPGKYATNFVNMVENLGEQMSVMQLTCGYRSQKFPVYIQLGRKESKWDSANGLQSIIPAVLTLGIMGYPFVIPDVIGGSGYSMNITEPPSPPNKELYIRWLQIAVYMPVLKFSYTPWDLGQDVVDIAVPLLKRRRDTVVPILIKAAREAETIGTPIIRPLWWNDPSDVTALSIGSQFLVGKDLMVAPVVAPGVTEIDIYLPTGDWKDGNTGKIHKGKQWLRDYAAPLGVVPNFNLYKTHS
ncbi:hypothetical protein FSP39_012360 [Pinctada imbricata]|uniref:Uncharacterized protein n=1 Tax=Pinctada imbricata TaxID=66713 RepID=A0AA88XP41_PINIB|nr:hypothetical protein FSP39_012360 [Pinctada imbricata]